MEGKKGSNIISDILKGVVIGIANVIPGVSGGTMMVSMGIYDRIISSINSLFKSFKKSVKTLLPYLIGMAIGIVLLSFAIEFLFERFPFPTATLFIGLILGGIPMTLDKVKGRKPELLGIILFVIFFLLIIGLEFFRGKESTGGDVSFGLVNAIILFGIGVVASATMIIPGVSGSMMLMILGYYSAILENTNGLIKSILSFDMGSAIVCAGVLIPFGIGILVGMFAVAKLIEMLLLRHERLTCFAILGLVCASPIAILSGIGIGDIDMSLPTTLVGIVTFAAGVMASHSLSAKEGNA